MAPKRKRPPAQHEAADVMTVEEAAVKLRIGRNQAYENVKSGKIPAIRLGRRWIIPRVAFHRFLNGAA
jgi:excisionase family DNA binding protein